jgi:chromosome partitioning protein
MEQLYTVQKIMNLFAMNIARGTLVKAEETGAIPKSQREKMGSISKRAWQTEDLPKIGERYGFLEHLENPIAMVFFTTKGGVLKTTLAYHMARIAAFHNIKTCVVGLDLQNDITRLLTGDEEPDDDEDIEGLLSSQEKDLGIANLFRTNARAHDLVRQSDLSTLYFIPEGPELIRLEKQLHTENRREDWLKKNVIEPLKKHFELIVIDCPPNWNLLVSNALVASDVLVSPVECRINQFRNLVVFQDLINEFRKEMDLRFNHVYLPTRFSPMRKINSGIRRWYLKNLPGVTDSAIRESTIVEEAIAKQVTIFEHAPKNMVADEMRQAIKEIWRHAYEKSAYSQTKKQKTRPSESNIPLFI